jgi:serine/threonine-protein kinase RsbW
VIGPSPDFAFAVPAVAANVARARAAIVGAAAAQGAGARLQRSIALAVSEAVSNAVVHAYRDRDVPGEVRLALSRCGDGPLCISVADDGLGMTPRPDSPGLGLGLPLIAQLADDLQVDTAGGTTLVMRFALAG